MKKLTAILLAGAFGLASLGLMSCGAPEDIGPEPQEQVIEK